MVKPVVNCTDVAGLVDHVLNERKVCRSEVFLKIGPDGGGSSSKITLSIIEKHKKPGKRAKDTGVKKIFLLAVAPGIPEKHCSIKKIWTNLLKLNNLEAVTAGDLKNG